MVIEEVDILDPPCVPDRIGRFGAILIGQEGDERPPSVPKLKPIVDGGYAHGPRIGRFNAHYPVGITSFGPSFGAIDGIGQAGDVNLCFGRVGRVGEK